MNHAVNLLITQSAFSHPFDKDNERSEESAIIDDNSLKWRQHKSLSGVYCRRIVILLLSHRGHIWDAARERAAFFLSWGRIKSGNSTDRKGDAYGIPLRDQECPDEPNG